MIQSIHLCCCYLNPSALIWPYIFWQMLSYLRDSLSGGTMWYRSQFGRRSAASLYLRLWHCLIEWQRMWRYLALCAFRYSGYLEIQPHCTLARDRPNMLNFTETAYTPGVHGNMSNLDIQCACPSFRFELLIFCILPPALMLVVDLLPKLSFWTVHVWPCANAPSFHFELFIFCDVRIPWAFISFAMYTDRESVLARLTCHSILILSTAASIRWTF